MNTPLSPGFRRILLAVLVLSAFCSQTVLASDPLLFSAAGTGSVAPIAAPKPEAAAEDGDESSDRILLTAAGDFTLGTYKGQARGGRFDEIYAAYGPDYFMEHIKPVFEQDDYTLINLEGPLTGHPATASKKFPIRGEKEYVQILTGARIEGVSLANNHTSDAGSRGLSDCMELLDQHHIDYARQNAPICREIKGIKIGILAYSVLGYSPYEAVRQAIAQCRADGCQFVIVYFHWGIEGEHTSSPEQEKLARFCIDQGADLILGSHPHVIQGIELYKEKPIVYSLGNFCFGANKNPADKDTFLFQQELLIDRTANTVSLGKTTLLPCRISSDPGRNNYQPVLLDEKESARVLKRLKQYSAQYGSTIPVLQEDSAAK